MLKVQIPNHKLFEKPRLLPVYTDFYDKVKVLYHIEFEPSNDYWKAYVSVFTSSESKDYTFTFPKPKGDVAWLTYPQKKVLYVLAHLCAVYFAIHTNATPQPDTFGALSVEGTEEVASFMQDYIWQSKMLNFWGEAFKTRQSENLELSLIDRFRFIPTEPYIPYTFDASDLYALKNLKKEDAVLSMSFGKESLLSMGLLQKHFGSSPHMSVINYTGTENIEFDKLKGFMALYPKLAAKMQFESAEPLSFVHPSTNMFEVNNSGDSLEIKLMHQQVFACMHYLATGKPVVIFGDEYERTYSNEIIINDQEYPVYTFDYSQSMVMHAKFNRLMSNLGVDLKVSSLLYNLSELQVQYLGPKYVENFGSYQTSCWFSKPGKPRCGECSKCARIEAMQDYLAGFKLSDSRFNSGVDLFAVEQLSGDKAQFTQLVYEAMSSEEALDKLEYFQPNPDKFAGNAHFGSLSSEIDQDILKNLKILNRYFF